VATKAELANAEIVRERAHSNPKRKRAAKPARGPKPHNWGERAGRDATVSYEVSNGRASRKSTRSSVNHQRIDNPLERTQRFKQVSPANRARVAAARSSKVGGKS